MPYLSRIRINPARTASRRMLANPHVVHGVLNHGLPDPNGAGRTLWRWERRNPYRPELLVLTVVRPDWSHVVEQAGWPDAGDGHADVADYRPVLARLGSDPEFAFRLVANPIRSSAPEQRGLRGARLPHRTPAYQLDWLLRRAQGWGFTVPSVTQPWPAPGLDEPTPPAPDVRITDRTVVRFQRRRDAAPIVLTTACFEGKLVVVDPDRLQAALLSGLGPGKAYGCGLLTLAPAPAAPPSRPASGPGMDW